MKLILEAIKAMFRKIEASRTHWDTRQIINTTSVTVSGNTAMWGFVKVADEVDFDINSIKSMTRTGSDGHSLKDVPVSIMKDTRNALAIATFTPPWYDQGWGVYFPTQEDADAWLDNPNIVNPFTPGLYMWVDCAEAGAMEDNPDCINFPVEVTYSFGITTGELKKLDEKYLPDKVVEAGAKIGKVEKLAGDASDTAADALSKALDNRPDVILQGTVSSNGDYISVNHIGGPVHGRIYVIIPDKTTTSGTVSPKISFNGVLYSISSGIMDGPYNTAINANALFVANRPLIVMYDKTYGFRVINRLSRNYVELPYVDNVDDRVPVYFAGFDYTSMSSVSSRYKYMRVKSSTEGSAKLFDIQVDDSGTITAVEVTE